MDGAVENAGACPDPRDHPRAIARPIAPVVVEDGWDRAARVVEIPWHRDPIPQ